jgi:hypothetical protein
MNEECSERFGWGNKFRSDFPPATARTVESWGANGGASKTTTVRGVHARSWSRGVRG